MTARIAPFLWLAALAFAPLAAHAGEGVTVIQESNGFPGGEKANDLSKQEVTVRGGKLRVLDVAHSWALFVDLDEGKVREAAVDLKEYSERAFSYYHKYRDERAENLKSQAEDWLRRKKRLEAKGDERRLRRHIDEYRKIGGDPVNPGKIVARLQYYPQDRRTETILVDRKETQIVVEHYVIRENQCDTPIFDLWTTHSVEAPGDLFRFYRELGTFSPEVSAKLEKVPGTLIRCTAVLDTGSLKRTFRSRVLELRFTDGVRGTLSVPGSWKKIDPDATPAGPARPEGAKTCEVCQTVMAPGAELRYVNPFTRRRQYACSNAHRVQLIKRINDEQKNKPKR